MQTTTTHDIEDAFMERHLRLYSILDVPLRRFERGSWAVLLDRAFVGGDYYLRSVVLHGDRIMSVRVSVDATSPGRKRELLRRAILAARRRAAREAASAIG